ncbi:DNA topoisomerase IV subunit A [Sphingoaurantiacus capsulatus]|uniref:DNA topoisomerase 4 subunit A n=1 Tax=Sphingoaurantiacus capsulatus TaxID=1771310 RepID=A0ABV7XAW3_9SPHN
MTELNDSHDRIIETPFAEALSGRYLVYAMSTITARSLPDVRDGLKPVHRRLLWAMRLLKLDPASGYKKCARVIGDVIGKYHPHGDQSVYDALVRLAQTFALRYPLVDGQGNFGNIDGDNAAAMRYTEARLTAAAAELMDGLDENCVPFRTTYNGEDEEPEVFPALFPNLLANGASGIAVGMATSIPPHNVAELIDAATLLIDNEETTVDELLTNVQGPDFPTGGVCIESQGGIREAYVTGRGSFRLRARWEKVEVKGGGWYIVISEIPFQVQKGKLIEEIAALVTEKKLPILEDVRDESDAEIRLVLEPRSRNVDPGVLMESLFKLTDLEVRFPLNLNVLDKTRTPKVMGLKDALLAYLDHQIEVLVARSKYRLQKIEDRLELLAGFLIAYLNLDEVIRIIREEDEPKQELILTFELTDRQAEAILNMRLRSLRRLEEMEIGKENKALTKEAGGLRALLDSPRKQRDRVKADLAQLRARYGPETELGRRRTSFDAAPSVIDIPLEAMIEREPITVIASAKGWIRAMKGHVELASAEAVKFKEGDGPAFAFHAQTTDKIVVAADNGRFYTLGADRLPGGRGFGEPIRLMVDMEANAEIVALFTYAPTAKLLLAANDGKGFVVAAPDVLAETKKGRQVMTPRTGAKLKIVHPIAPDADHIAVVGDNRKLLIFPLNQVVEMSRGQGVTIQKYKDGGLSDVMAFRLADGLSWQMGGKGDRVRTESVLTDWMGDRSQAGRLPPNGFPRDNRFS